MLYELLIQGENDRWETFKKAEREAERQNGLRGDADRGRVRKLFTRRRQLATATARRAAHAAGRARRGALRDDQVDELPRNDDRLANLAAVEMRLNPR